MYWWTPDDSFLDMAPELMILPPHNKFAFSQGDVTSGSERIDAQKVISSDLEFMAPDFVRLLRNSQPLGANLKGYHCTYYVPEMVQRR